MGNFFNKTTKTYYLEGRDIIEIGEDTVIYRDPDRNNQLHVYLFDKGLAREAIDIFHQSKGKNESLAIDVCGQTIYGVGEYLSTNASPGSRGYQVDN